MRAIHLLPVLGFLVACGSARPPNAPAAVPNTDPAPIAQMQSTDGPPAAAQPGRDLAGPITAMIVGGVGIGGGIGLTAGGAGLTKDMTCTGPKGLDGKDCVAPVVIILGVVLLTVGTIAVTVGAIQAPLEAAREIQHEPSHASGRVF